MWLNLNLACRQLLAVNGVTATTFVELEAALDDSVGRSVTLTVARAGAVREVPLAVGDLHAITPSRFLEMGDCVLHDLSYHVALAHNIPVQQGVYVADAVRRPLSNAGAPGFIYSRAAPQGFMLAMAGVPAGAVITHVGATPTPTVDALYAALAALPDGAAVPVTVFNVQNRHVQAKAVVHLDRAWFPTRLLQRDPATGAWAAVQPPSGPAAAAASPAGAAPVAAPGDAPSPAAGPARTCVCTVARAGVGLCCPLFFFLAATHCCRDT